MSTTWVDMYHPALGNVHVLADSSAVSLYEAHGWVLSGGGGPTPDPIDLTPALGDLRYVQLADRTTFVPFWTAAEAVTTGAVRVDATGHLITANSNRTTRSTYDATEQAAWTVVAGGGGGAVSSVATRTGAVILTSSDLTDSTATGRALIAAADAPTVRTALGLGTAATQPSSAFDAAGAATTAAAARVPLLIPTATKTATYTAAVGDLAMMNVASGGTVLNLPAAPADKSQVGYRAIGASVAVPLTVNRGGSTDTIGTTGATTATVPLADETLIYQYDAPNTRWISIANVKTKASLDAAYALPSQTGNVGKVLTTDGTSPSWGTPAAGTSSTRRCMAVLSTPSGASQTQAEMTFRLSTAFPATTTRWRVRIRNYQVLSEAAVATGASFVGLYHGQHALDSTGAVTGGFVSTPTQALTAFTLPSDGSEYISAWITDAPNQIPVGLPWLFSFGYTGGDTSTGQAAGAGMTWVKTGAGSSSTASQTSNSGLASQLNAPFDIRIEYDTVTAGKVTLAAGDSITWGNASAVIPQNFAWPTVYGRRTGNPTMNGGIASVTATQWAGATSQWKYQRWDPTNVPVDQVIVNLGTNDVSAGRTLVQFEGDLLTVLANLRALYGSGVRVVLSTLTPRGTNVHGVLTRPVASGATTFTSSTSLGNLAFQVGEGTRAETVTVTGTNTNNGDGTFTMTTTTAFTKNHSPGEVAAQTPESLRLQYNFWLSSLPGGALSCAFFDRAWAAPYDTSAARSDMQQTDNLHPTQSGSARLALEASSAA